MVVEPKIKNIKAGELLAALNSTVAPMHLVYKKKNNEIVNSYGTRNIEYLKKLNLTNAHGMPVDLSKMDAPKGIPLSTHYKTVIGNIEKRSRYSYYDTAAKKWRSFTVGQIVGMTKEEQAEVIKNIVAAERYIDPNSVEANALMVDKVGFIKMLAIADEVAKKKNKDVKDITPQDVIDLDITKDVNEATKIASAPRLHKEGSLKIKL